MKILIVEDTLELAHSLKSFFSLEKNQVEIAVDLEEAKHFVSVSHFDMILLDIMLPDGDGRDFLRELRNSNNNVPVIVMTARSEISDRIDLLDIGADDYIIKPFDFAEVEARCRAVLRRHRGQDQLALSFGGVTLFPLMAELEKNGIRVSLRNRELRLLEIFFNSIIVCLSLKFLILKLLIIPIQFIWFIFNN